VERTRGRLDAEGRTAGRSGTVDKEENRLMWTQLEIPSRSCRPSLNIINWVAFIN
jgi:hypothetical protein